MLDHRGMPFASVAPEMPPPGPCARPDKLPHQRNAATGGANLDEKHGVSLLRNRAGWPSDAAGGAQLNLDSGEAASRAPAARVARGSPGDPPHWGSHAHSPKVAQVRTLGQRWREVRLRAGPAGGSVSRWPGKSPAPLCESLHNHAADKTGRHTSMQTVCHL